MRPLVLLLAFATGCLNEYGEYDLGGGGGGGGGGGYAPPVMTTTGSRLAVGGSTVVTVANGTATGVQVRQSSPAFDLVVDPSRAGFTEYVLTARAAAETTLIASSLNYSDLVANIAAFDLEAVHLEPVESATHHPHGSDIVWHTSMKQAVIALSGSGHRLVDISLDVMFASSEAIELTAWDTLTLPTTAGRYTVLVSADSFGQRQLAFELVADVDRLETSVEGTLARVGDSAEICIYPMNGTRDVATPVAITLLGDLTQTGIASGSNCRRVKAKSAGIKEVEARALGRTTSLSFTIAP